MSTYSTRVLMGVVPLPAGLSYTVPAGFIFVIRDVEANNQAAGENNCYIQITSTPGVGLLAINNPIEPAKSTQWQGRTVLNPGDVLAVGASSASLYVTISGYLLTQDGP